MALKNMESFEVASNINLVDLLVNTNILSSKREAREFIKNASISVNGEKITDLDFLVNKENALYHKYTVIRKGKKKYYVIKLR